MKKARILAFLLTICLILPAFAVTGLANDAAVAETGSKGDANGDGVVDSRDLVVMRQYLAWLDYSTGISSKEIDMSADMNGDGVVRLTDVVLLIDFLVNGDEEPEVTYSEGLKFTSNGDGTCYVRGMGDCTDTDVVIPPVSPNGDSVTRIGSYAFYNCTSLASIEIPDSVTSIGDEAFSYCTSLASIKIPDSVTSIGNYAFRGCTSLASVVIGDSVTSIGKYAFYNCKNLKTVNYTGTEEQWKAISIGSNNSYLENAPINYNYKPE